MHAAKPIGDARVAIEDVSPEIDGGRFPAKAAVGDVLVVEADIFCDGHDKIAAALLIRRAGEARWREAPMVLLRQRPLARRVRLSRERPLSLHADRLARPLRILARRGGEEARRRLCRRARAEEGRQLVETALRERERGDAATMTGADGAARRIFAAATTHAASRLLVSQETADLMKRARRRARTSRAIRASWSLSSTASAPPSAPGTSCCRARSRTIRSRHGTFDDVIAQLPYVRDLGFDVLYFPPIHPIGRTQPQGQEQQPDGRPGRSRQPLCHRLGGRRPRRHPSRARHASTISRGWSPRRATHGLEIALDFAIQCSPDHPWIKEHPEWFDWRPDGTIKYAENPPKKYEDIVNVHFYRQALPVALVRAARRRAVLGGARREDLPRRQPAHQAVPVLGMDDPRGAGPLSRRDLPRRGLHPAEGDEAPRQGRLHPVLYLLHLAQHQGGADRVSDRADARRECREYYAAELLRQHARHQSVFPADAAGGPAFRARLVLAATLAGNYGIYSGFELCEAAPVPGKEEYLELGEIRDQGLGLGPARQHPRRHPAPQPAAARAPGAAVLREPQLLQRLERQHPLLRQDDRRTRTTSSCSPSTSIRTTRRARDFEVPLWEFGLPDDASIDVEDLVTGTASPGTARSSTCCSTRASAPTPSGGSHRRREAPHDDALEPPACRDRRAVERRPEQSAQATSIARSRDWYKDAVIYQLHVKAFHDSNGDGIGDFAGLMQRLDYVAEPRRHRHLAAARSIPRRCATTATTSPTIARSIRPTATWRDFRRFVARGAPARHPRHHRARHQPHLRPASLVPARADGAARLGRARLLRLERHRPDAIRARASSSSTRRSRTGPGTRSPRPTSGTASIRTSRT